MIQIMFINIKRSIIHSFIIDTTYPLWDASELEPIPADIGQKAGYTMVASLSMGGMVV